MKWHKCFYTNVRDKESIGLGCNSTFVKKFAIFTISTLSQYLAPVVNRMVNILASRDATKQLDY